MKNNTLAIKVNRLKLERMILEGEDYDKILKQSQKLDKYINIAMKERLEKLEKNKK
ncbi:MAG TPA: Spo0E family sporulation regulatory protein-aspartic acid phosphatase [Candidatus Merdicola faecigallinarum]|uniref:Spo0E family sporulation regulatory protein-aspartic acid phosphatase n=1 Tax=Candidatus Merdicola faecigallinarum TaxID=2840862 RepID=A0A9D1M253_9FIRM|nr:Spo0E family sporulation regulatory protein-aspartic acid phosphatase [Candidatus Merdicola faecigallinarum]